MSQGDDFEPMVDPDEKVWRYERQDGSYGYFDRNHVDAVRKGMAFGWWGVEDHLRHQFDRYDWWEGVADGSDSTPPANAPFDQWHLAHLLISIDADPELANRVTEAV